MSEIDLIYSRKISNKKPGSNKIESGLKFFIKFLFFIPL